MKLTWIGLLLLWCGVVPFLSGCRKHVQIQPVQQTSQGPMETEPAVPVPDTDDSHENFKDSGLVAVFFDYDRYEIRMDQIPSLRDDAKKLRELQGSQVILEGHCDERGTEEYNLALGDRRATAVRQYLIDLGVPESQIRTVSFGESKPFAFGHNEEAWHLNRRAQPLIAQKSE
jgi:peptidoglycan-associated lipoprotein